MDFMVLLHSRATPPAERVCGTIMANDIMYNTMPTYGYVHIVTQHR